MGAFRHSLIEILLYSAHLIGHMGEAHHGSTACFGKRVERGSFHFDRENAATQCRRYCLLGFPKRSIGRPTGSDAHGHSGRRERRARELRQIDIPLDVFGCRQVVIARTFITQRSVDNDKIRRSLHRSDLAGGCDADEKAAAGCEKLLCYQDSKCSSDCATHNAVFVPVATKEYNSCGSRPSPRGVWRARRRTSCARCRRPDREYRCPERRCRAVVFACALAATGSRG